MVTVDSIRRRIAQQLSTVEFVVHQLVLRHRPDDHAQRVLLTFTLQLER
jgi:hypothetical protein